jgi:uncharacterized low-complexity protein
MKILLNKMLLATVGALLALSVSTSTMAGENLFGFTKTGAVDQQVVVMSDGKCGEGKCGSSKDGSKKMEGKCGGSKDSGKKMEGKCGAGKCGGSKDSGKKMEGKCGGK